jgi:hypothetical protein
LFCFFFEIGSCELFACAGFKPRFSWVAVITGVSHWHSAYNLYFWDLYRSHYFLHYSFISSQNEF